MVACRLHHLLLDAGREFGTETELKHIVVALVEEWKWLWFVVVEHVVVVVEWLCQNVTVLVGEMLLTVVVCREFLHSGAAERTRCLW